LANTAIGEVMRVSHTSIREPELGGETPPSAGAHGANTDYYVIAKSGSIAQAQRTRHYILNINGNIAFVLHGSKREQIVKNVKERGLRYHVIVYRTGSGNRCIEIVDMWTLERIFYWTESYGIKELLNKAPKFLAEVLKKEVISESNP